MDFILSVPRHWYTTCVGDGDWVYLAGGVGSRGEWCQIFEKINVLTGAAIELQDEPESSPCCHLIDY